MKKRLFDNIMQGMREAIAIAKGDADPATYRVHAPPSSRQNREVNRGHEKAPNRRPPKRSDT